MLAEIHDNAATNGCRPEYVTLQGRRLLATADYGDVRPAVRLYDPRRLVAARRSSAPGVCVAAIPCDPFNQNLFWDANSGELTCVENVVAGLGWKLDVFDLEKAVADGKLEKARRRTFIFPPHSELEGWLRQPDGREVFVTSSRRTTSLSARGRRRRRFPRRRHAGIFARRGRATMSRHPAPLMQSPPGTSTIIDGREFLYFVGCGYLGLQGRAEVIEAACDAARQYGVGSATTRAGYGTTPPLVAVERLAAELVGAEDAFYLPSGYASSQVAAAALADSCDAVVLNELSHYCLFDAARATGQPTFRFAHCDAAALRTVLIENVKPGQRSLVLTDGVFAAHGDVAPLADYEAILCDWPGASLLIDDAHSLGVLGSRGRGTLEHAGLLHRAVNDLPEAAASDRPALYFCGTLSKAWADTAAFCPAPGDGSRG